MTSDTAFVFAVIVVAAVLIYRALSYLIQVPMGLVAYAIFKSKKSWRIEPQVT